MGTRNDNDNDNSNGNENNFEDEHCVDEEELAERLDEVAEKIDGYLARAEDINHDFISRHDKYVPLDDIPYGEEVLRLREFPKSLEAAQSGLDLLPDGQPDSVRQDLLKEIEELVEEAESTLDDCTELPPLGEDQDWEDDPDF